MVDKVVATPAALELIARLKAKHGDGLLFHQSGGCCDNSAANCYLLGELSIGPGDVHLGDSFTWRQYSFRDLGGSPNLSSASRHA